MSTPRRPGAPRSSSKPTARAAASRPQPRPQQLPLQFTQVRPLDRPDSRAVPARKAQPVAEASHRIVPTRPQGSATGMVTWRALVLLAVVVLAATMVAPSVRAYMAQQDELAELRAEVEAARAEVDDLEAELHRWDDPWYIQAQARERLAYVFPGEVPYRVVDPESVDDYAEGSLAHDNSAEGTAGVPWWEQIEQSLDQSGNGGVAP